MSFNVRFLSYILFLLFFLLSLIYLLGLDVVGFGVFKSKWKTLLLTKTSRKPNKSNYLQLILEPFREAFSEKNVKAGFRETGVWPLDATRITPEKMAPSKASSYQSLFPLPQLSPVRHLV
jgi:hypothetical protein